MKRKMFRKILLTAIGLLSSNLVFAQWQDSFEEGLDAWQGNKDFFVADGGTLRSKGNEAKSVIYLSRAFRRQATPEDSVFWQSVLRADSALCFEFGVSLQFIPSSTNALRLYLLCNDSNLNEAKTALYLHLGQKGGENRWQFFFSTPDTTLLLWQGNRVYSKQKQMTFDLRVLYFARTDTKEGCWHFYHRDAETPRATWQREGDSLFTDFVEDVFFSDSLLHDKDIFYSGLMARYQTTSRADKYAFEYALAGRVPPVIVEQDTVFRPIHHANDTLFAWNVDMEEVYPRLKAGDLVINEILFNPLSGMSRFVEIKNLLNRAVAMNNLALGVPGDKGWKYALLCKEKGGWLPKNSYVAFAKEAQAIDPNCRYVAENIRTASSFPTLNDKAGRLRLVRLPSANDSVRDTLLLDEVFYSEEFHHWLLPDVRGVSLERLDARRPALSQENWASAAETSGYATPGGENSHQRQNNQSPEADYFRLEPPLLTPNNDGRNDYTYIRWNRKLSGCVCSISVYDENGRKMKTLCHQLLLGAGGEIRYDATDASGRILRPGVYVIYIDLIRADKKHKRLRYVLAVG